jgi:small GTP-binding protein
MPVLEFKVVIIGSAAVGKTSITQRLQFGQFDEEYQPTVGAGYVSYRTKHDDQDVELQIWDTAGTERYRSLAPIYYRDAVAAVVVCDQTDQSSADALEGWITNFKQNVKGPAYIAIAANKDDLEEKVVNPETVRQWAADSQFDFFVTSAKSGKGVTELFDTLIRHLVASSGPVSAAQKPPMLGQAAARNGAIGACC